MAILGIIASFIGFGFSWRWFRQHKFEYLEGVKPSEQLDFNFWMGNGFMLVGLIIFICLGIRNY